MRYTTAELKRIVDEADRDARREMVEREVAARLRQRRPAPAEVPEPPPLTRKGMTPKQVSDYVEQHGVAAYLALPRG